MIVRNNKTSREYPVTDEGWKAIERKGWAKNFTVVSGGTPATKKKIISTSFIPDEVKTTDNATGKRPFKSRGTNKNNLTSQ